MTFFSCWKTTKTNFHFVFSIIPSVLISILNSFFILILFSVGMWCIEIEKIKKKPNDWKFIWNKERERAREQKNSNWLLTIARWQWDKAFEQMNSIVIIIIIIINDNNNNIIIPVVFFYRWPSIIELGNFFENRKTIGFAKIKSFIQKSTATTSIKKVYNKKNYIIKEIGKNEDE